MNPRSIIPENNEALNSWADQAFQNITPAINALGLKDDYVAGFKATAQEIVTTTREVYSTDTAAHTAVEKSKNMHLPGGAIDKMHKYIAHIKTLDGYTTDIGKSLGFESTPPAPLDTANYKAQISVHVEGNVIRIKFVKHGVDYVNIYRRKKGTADWTFVTHYTHSPYDDHITLSTSGQPEHWEYMAYGAKNDKEIGQPSDIQQVVYGQSV